jgi:uncharacterized protein YqeY
MGIFDRVREELTGAMRTRDAARTSALRGIRAALLNECKKDGSETLSDEVCVAVLRRLEKQRFESIEAFAAVGRADRADAERAELAVVREFVPALADEATTRAWVETAIAESGARESRDLGRVMAALMKARKGEIDGRLAREIAAQLLASN